MEAGERSWQTRLHIPHIPMQIVNLDAATSADHDRALDEVKDFRLTDMGRGGSERWTYRLLPEPLLTAELVRLAHPQRRGPVDSVTLQPCTSYQGRNQDRFCTQEWNLPGGRWLFNGIFDGHLGHETVNYVATRLPASIHASLRCYLNSHSVANLSYDAVTDLLREAFIGLDNSLVEDFFSLLGNPKAQPMGVHGSDGRQFIRQYAECKAGQATIARCLQGSTALVTLTDPTRTHLWVANLGDCQAVIGRRDRTGRCVPIRINNSHNCDNASELMRVVEKHPGECCIAEDRILGFSSVTRAMGDIWLKLPAFYTERIFANVAHHWLPSENLHQYVPHMLTPPYVSNTPDVYHRTIDPERDLFLILATDGLLDLYEGWGEDDMLARWVKIVQEAPTSNLGRTTAPCGYNLALALLRDALGGSDTERVSRNLTVEADIRLIDDTTILVQRFR